MKVKLHTTVLRFDSKFCVYLRLILESKSHFLADTVPQKCQSWKINNFASVYTVFFIGLKVFVHLTNLKLLQIGKKKIFVWFELTITFKVFF